MTSTPQVFQSRWGFHPCDYATYRKLKLLNQVYLRSVRLARAWQRWQRKEPHNRVSRRRVRNGQGQTVGYGPPVPLAEPPVCPVFSQKVYRTRFVDKKGGRQKEGFLEETCLTDDFGVAAAYAAVRRPAAEPGQVRPLGLSAAEIDALYDNARGWLERQDVG